MWETNDVIYECQNCGIYWYERHLTPLGTPPTFRLPCLPAPLRLRLALT
jgi:hypothetical protein